MIFHNLLDFASLSNFVVAFSNMLVDKQVGPVVKSFLVHGIDGFLCIISVLKSDISCVAEQVSLFLLWELARSDLTKFFEKCFKFVDCNVGMETLNKEVSHLGA